MILKIFNLKRGNRDREETSDTSFMKKEHKQVTKDQKVWTQGHWLLVNDLLSHAQYRDPYFDFMVQYKLVHNNWLCICLQTVGQQSKHHSLYI